MYFYHFRRKKLNYFLFLIFLSPFFVLDVKKLHAIQCNSPVWRSTTQCLGKKNRLKESNDRDSQENLGTADIEIQSFRKTQKFKARCGSQAKECIIQFVDQRLSVDNGRGIIRDQFIHFDYNQKCKRKKDKILLINFIYQKECNHNYTIIYRDDNRIKRIALISFNQDYLIDNEFAYKTFSNELKVWLKDRYKPLAKPE